MTHIALWTFNNPATADDIITNDGGAQNGTYEDGASALGGNLVLDGTDDYALIPADPAFQLDTGTLVMEVTPDTVHDGTIFSRDSNGVDDGGHVRIRVNADGSIDMRTQSSTADTDYTTPTGFYSAGDDIRITFSWDEGGAGGTFKVENLTQSTSHTEAVANDVTWDMGASYNEPITIGADQDGSSDNTADNLDNFFDGDVSYVSLFDTVEDPGGPLLPITGTAGVDTLIGDGGDDTISGLGGNDHLTGGEGDDSIDGGDGRDTLIGSAGDDTLSGGAGDDQIYAREGADQVDGGTGNDWVRYNGGSGQDISVDLNTGIGTGGDAEGDTYTNIENVWGDGGDDTLLGDGARNFLTGDAGDDSIDGGGGNDTIRGGAGADTLEGGAGTDKIRYFEDTVGVNVDLSTNTASGGEAQGDVISNFENIEGGSGDDTLTGDAGNNWLDSHDGDDSLSGGAGSDNLNGGAGADTLDGGDGNDRLSYFRDDTGVNVDLSTNTASGGEAQGDVISNFENIEGGSGDDTITGDAGNNVLDGGAGDDSLSGGAGHDNLRGDAGADTLDGGDGYDWLSYFRDTTGVNVDIGANTASGGDAQGDVISNFERLQGGSGDDTLAGNSGSNVIDGRAGDDILTGGGGTDNFWIRDGYGNDTITDFEVPTHDGDGTWSGGDTLTVNLLTSDGSTPVTTDDVVISDTNGDGTGDAILTFPGGETLTLQGVLPTQIDHPEILAGMGIPLGDDGTVNGTGAGENIGAGFVDADGDAVDAGDNLDGNDDDLIDAGAGDDTVNAGAGDDTILAGEGDDLVQGGDGDDVIIDTGGNATLSNGDDTFYGGDGDDLIIGQFAGTHADGTVGTNVFYGGAGNDTLVSGNSRETMHGGDGDDLIFTGNVSQVVYANEGNDTVVGSDEAGTSESDTILGGAGNDSLSSGFVGTVNLHQGDSIDGGTGNDTVTGGDADDTLTGGSGDDSVLGGGGDDRIVLEDGFGTDTLDGGATGTDDDTLDAGAMTTDATVTFAANPEDGTLTEGANSATFTDIENVITGAGNDTIDATAQTASGTGINVETGAGDDSIDGGAGDDTIDGGAGADTVEAGAGDDTVLGGAGNDDIQGGAGNDTLTGNDGNDFLDGGDGNDSLSGDAGNDTLIGGAGDDSLRGVDGNNSIEGGDGNDRIWGGDGDDVADGGAGSDTISGDLGNDTLSGGDDDDTVNGLDGDDVLSGDAGNDVVSGGGQNDLVDGGDGDDLLQGGADNDTLIGGAGNDSLYAASANPLFVDDATDENTLTGGTGDDLLGAGAGLDTFVFADGDGNDTITGFDFGDTDTDGFTNDQLDVTGLTSDGGTTPVTTDDVTLSDTNGDGTGDAILTFPGGESITLEGVTPDQIDDPAILHSMGIPLGTKDYTVDGTAGNDNINGSYVDADGDAVDGNDNLYGTNDDVIDAGAGDDTIIGGAGADIIDGGDGVDFVDYTAETADLTIDISDGLAESGGNAEGDILTNVENVRGGDGDDSITGNASDNFLRGNEGDDTVDGGAGDDRIIGGGGVDSLSGGDGDDMLYGQLGADTLDGGAGIDQASYSLDNTGVNIDLGAGTASGGEATGDVLTNIENLRGGSAADTLTGDAGANELRGEGGDDILTGGAGDDSLIGGTGDDSYVFADGSGADVITDFDMADADTDGFTNDQLDVSALTSDGGTTPVTTDDVVISDTNGDGTGDAILTFPGGESITLTGITPAMIPDAATLVSMGIPAGTKDYTVDGTAGNDNINGSYVDADGDAVDGNDNLAGTNDDVIDAGAGNDTVRAGDGNDNVLGGDGDDVIRGEAGDDTLDGGAGSDNLIGGDGDDVLAGGAGDDLLNGQAGADAIDGGDGVDRVVLNGATATDIDLTDALAESGGEAEGDTYTNVEEFVLSQGDDVFVGDAGVTRVSGRDGDDDITTDAGEQALIGGTGNDTLSAGAGDDLIRGQEDDDLIDGGAGEDLLYGDEGSDTIDGGDGRDAIYGGDGADVADGGAADDLLRGGDGDDSLTGGDGGDVLMGDAGNDTLDGGAGSDISIMTTGSGADTFDGGADDDALVIEGGATGADVTYDGAGSGTANLGADSTDFSNVETIALGAGDDTLDASLDTAGMTGLGGAGDDSLTGGSGDDVLIGDGGSWAWERFDVDPASVDGDTLLADVGFTLNGGRDNTNTPDDTGFSSAIHPDAINPGEHQAFKFTTDLTITQGGDYDFSAVADDNVRIFIDGVEIINGDSQQSATFYDSASQALTPGTYTIEVIYLQGGTDQALDLRMSGPDTGGISTSLQGYPGVSAPGVAGDDTLEGGAGDDALTGGAGDDTFVMADGSGADIITDFDMGDDDTDGFTNDQLDVSGLTDASGNPVNVWDAVVTDTNGDGTGDAILTFPNGESITLTGVTVDQVDTGAELHSMGIVCYVSGTMITTARGDVAVEDLRCDDSVLTAQGSYEPIVWKDRTTLTVKQLETAPNLRPVRIKPGTFGNDKALFVSQQHCMVVDVEGESRFVRAKHLAEYTGLAHIAKVKDAVTYHHVLLPEHAVIFANGAASESFYPGPQSLKTLSRSSLASLVSTIAPVSGQSLDKAYGDRALPCLNGKDVKARDTPAMHLASLTKCVVTPEISAVG